MRRLDFENVSGSPLPFWARSNSEPALRSAMESSSFIPATTTASAFCLFQSLTGFFRT